MRRIVTVTVVGLAILAGPSAAQDGAGRLLARQTVAGGPGVSVSRVVDVDGDGDDDLLVVGVDGRVRVHLADGGSLAAKPKGKLVLSHPARCLLALAQVLEDGPPQLIVLGPGGATLHPVGEDGAFSAEGTRLARRARFGIRTGRPLFSNIAQDTNGDGRLDLVVPGPTACELWLNRPPAAGDAEARPAFRRMARVLVRVSVRNQPDAGPGSDSLYHSITIPDLDIRDVNGDSRPDLIVSTRSLTRIHRQREDGTIPVEPDVVLDLDKFRDTTPPATVRPGYTLAGTERARRLIRDLDDDGLPDYVVAHRRKVWVFHGTPDGPAFTKPTTVMRTSDDVTALWVARLDDDERPDLLIFRVQLPTIGTLITGLLGSFSVEIRAVGYANVDGRRFSRDPTWRREITFKLPSLGEVMRNPDSFIRRFEEAGSTFRRSVAGDFNGDGRADLALLSRDEKRLQVWLSQSAADPPEFDDILREILFEDDDTTWDIDRLIAWIESLGTRQFQRLTEGRKPDAEIDLRDPAVFRLAELSAAALGQGPRARIVVTYESRTGDRVRTFDVIEAE